LAKETLSSTSELLWLDSEPLCARRETMPKNARVRRVSKVKLSADQEHL
jgi:hypothetical protein